MSAPNAYAVKVSLAADYFNNARIQLGTEAALAHALQRFDVRREDLLREACHYGRLPGDDELVGTEAW